MGYSTDFSGEFQFSRQLTVDESQYLLAFAEQRHSKRDAALLASFSDPLRVAVGLPVGVDGIFSVVDPPDATIDDSDEAGAPVESKYSWMKSKPPTVAPGETFDKKQAAPSLYCQWVPTQRGMSLEWDGNEKFYEYIEWLKFMIHNFFKPWGIQLNGEVQWQGEETGDVGKIRVTDNDIKILKPQFVEVDENE